MSSSNLFIVVHSGMVLDFMLGILKLINKGTSVHLRPGCPWTFPELSHEKWKLHQVREGEAFQIQTYCLPTYSRGQLSFISWILKIVKIEYCFHIKKGTIFSPELWSGGRPSLPSSASTSTLAEFSSNPYFSSHPTKKVFFSIAKHSFNYENLKIWFEFGKLPYLLSIY